MAYQMMFAIITPALITGAFVNRITFKAYLVFLVLWQLLVYYPFAHMVWGGGLLAHWGVLDFAGGIVVHAIAGFAALASVFYVGNRRDKQSPPNSIPLIAIGTGLLWFGWYGFNAGSELDVNAITGLAFLNTDVAASFAAIVWLTIEWIIQRKPKFVGLMTGAVAGLATITPAAGFVSLPSAALIGIAAGMVCYLAVHLKNKLGWDDALDVWGVHGIGGGLGVILLGVFASKAMNAAGADGLLAGGTRLRRAMSRRLRRGPLRVSLYLSHAGGDQFVHHGQGFRSGRGPGARRLAPRRAGLRFRGVVASRLVLLEQGRARDPLAFQENIRDRGERPYILQGIAIDDEQRGIFAFLDRADPVVGTEQLGGVRGRSPERDFRWNSGRDPELDFTLHGRTMEDEKVACVGAGHEEHARAPRFHQIAVTESSDIG